MGKLEKRIVRELGAGKTRAFSSFDDFVNLLIAEKRIESREDLLTTKADLLGSILFSWYVQGQIACAFAQILAKQPSDWESVVLPHPFDVNEVQSYLEENADKLEAVQLLFVGPATSDHALDILETLCSHSSWTCHDMGWMATESGESIQVGLRWHRPGSDYVAWVLGVASFDPMPFTRRFEGAPFIALVLRPSPPTKYAPIPDEGEFKASHLAHMNDGFGEDEEKRSKTKRITQYNKQSLLAGEPGSRARAKVTFAFLPEYRTLLDQILTPLSEAKS